MSQRLLPWQQADWQRLVSFGDRLPHAILLYGAAGIGKVALAELFAQALLCEQPLDNGMPCQTCPSCGWFSQYSHPDYRRIRPETLDEDEASADADDAKAEKTSKTKASREIVINQVRALSDFMSVSTHRQGKRVVLLYPAEALNIPAANALLKSLEEPQANTVFILVTHSLDRLLPTILSRCHKIALSFPEKTQALDWLTQQGVNSAEELLALQGGAPLAAQELAESGQMQEVQDLLQVLLQPSVSSALKVADKLQKSDLSQLTGLLQRWLYDLLASKQAGIVRYYPRQQKALHALAARVEVYALSQLIKRTQDRQAVASHPLSPKLFLEEMLLDYSTLISTP